MKASLYHVQLNVSRPSIAFYKDLLTYLRYTLMAEQPDMFGATNGTTDLWIMQTAPAHAPRGFHRKATGINHLAFRVESRTDVDRFTREFLDARAIPTLYGAPRDYPEYRPGYYAVFFEDPDRLKLEVAHIPQGREGRELIPVIGGQAGTLGDGEGQLA
jgi:catechol 2,3-dioxygenase-like lactoylglutathione lyase family enzyme